MMLKSLLEIFDKGTEISVFYIDNDGERKTIYTDLDGEPTVSVKYSDVYRARVSDNGVLECEVEEP